MTTRSFWIALVSTVIGAWLAACGAKQAAPRAQETSAGGAAVPGEGRPSEEIRALDARITTDLNTLGLAAPTDTEITEMVVAHSVPPPLSGAAADSCEAPPTGEGCSDVCTLADSICDNADRICELADQLAGDEWATQRCASGRMSCERARTRCCGC
jgi:hypothetical protein